MKYFKQAPRLKMELLKSLGEPYTMRIIDMEWCVYRDFGKYDVEISGGRVKQQPIHIFVWKKHPYYQIVEHHLSLTPEVKQIAELLNDIADRYENRLT